MRKYYYHRNGENYGPFTLEELAKENIKGDTLVWFKGMNEWLYARNVKELELLVKRHHYVESPPPVPQQIPPQPQMPVYQTPAQTIVYAAAPPQRRSRPGLWIFLIIIALYALFFYDVNTFIFELLQAFGVIEMR